MIQAKGLCKSFGANRAVDGVSFEIAPGEVVGLLGPNGAGKSTTMRMLTTYLEPDQGDATVFGHSIREDPMGVRAQLGYLPESAPLYLEMAIPAYLHYMASVHGVARRLRQVRVEEMIDSCGLTDVLDRKIGQLSRGYRQRVGLAATLIHQPPFLILDEPTSGLDPNQIVEIRRLIRRVAEHRTVLLSTHILPEVEATCDRVLILARGSLKADGTAEQLTRRTNQVVTYRVGILGDAPRASQALSDADFVQEIREAGREGRATFFQVRCHPGGAERVYQVAVAEGLVLVELSEDRSSLEQVFGDLTLGPEESDP